MFSKSKAKSAMNLQTPLISLQGSASVCWHHRASKGNMHLRTIISVLRQLTDSHKLLISLSRPLQRRRSLLFQFSSLYRAAPDRMAVFLVWPYCVHRMSCTHRCLTSCWPRSGGDELPEYHLCFWWMVENTDDTNNLVSLLHMVWGLSGISDQLFAVGHFFLYFMPTTLPVFMITSFICLFSIYVCPHYRWHSVLYSLGQFTQMIEQV